MRARTSNALPGRSATATAVAGLLALGALTAGCTSDTDGTDSAATPAAAPRVDPATWPEVTPGRGLAKGLSLPLEDYMQSYRDTVVLERASYQLQSECMAGYGFQVDFPTPGVHPPPNNNDANMKRRYGITDRQTAETHGYGLDEDPDRQQRQQLPELSAAAITILTGRVGGRPDASPAPRTYKGKEIPEGGCSTWALDRIGFSKIDFSLVSKLDYDSLEQSQKTAPVRKVLAAWSTCMKKKGYDAKVPYDASKLAPSPQGKPTERSIAVALADIDCKKSVDLVRIWFDADAAIQNRQIEKNKLELTEAKKANEDALKAAEKVLDG